VSLAIAARLLMQTLVFPAFAIPKKQKKDALAPCYRKIT
jgi:hypothetical protein